MIGELMTLAELVAEARERARVNEVNDGIARPYAGTEATVVLPPSDTIPADYREMGQLGQWRLSGDLQSIVVYESGAIVSGSGEEFGTPEDARKWAAALLSAAIVAEAAIAEQIPHPRVCRGCGCTDNVACDTVLGPCTWVETYDDNTGICTGCVFVGRLRVGGA
jgi:hypothetical protein